MYELFTIFVAQPWLALLPAVVMFLVWRWGPSRFALASAILWLLYAAWEYSIWQGLTCDEDCNIRVDLIVLAPVLLAMTLLGLFFAFRRNRTLPR